MKKDLLIVAGIQSNYRTILKQAIDVGKNYNFNTHILDLNALISGWKPYPNDWEQLGLTNNVTTIDTLKDLEFFVSNRTSKHNPIVLFLYPPFGKFRKAWKIFHSKFPHTGLITISPVPNADRQKDEFSPASLSRGIQYLATKIKSLIKPSPSFWIISGSECVPIFTSYFRSLKRTKLIYTHSLEYEFFHYGSNNSASSDDPAKGFLLLLDQGWFSKPKPNFLSDEEYPPAPRKKFNYEICSVLRQLSKDTGLEVVVSCHPKASIADTKILYDGFNVVDRPSAELVRDCKIAIANTSTSIGYAIMADKPLILFTSDELSRSIIHNAELAISRELDIEFINISQSEELNLSELTDPENRRSYTRYCQRYIRQNAAPTLPLWDSIFLSLSDLH
jgi:hypothetical protein